MTQNKISMGMPVEAVTKNGWWAMVAMKGLVLGMTRYRRVIFIDADMLVLEDFSEVERMPSGTAAPGLMYGEPFNSGLFIVEPSDDVLAAYSNVFTQSRVSEHGFDDVWLGTGRRWDFTCALSDQGVLFYLFRYKLKSGGYLDPSTYGYPACATEFSPAQYVDPKLVHFKGGCKRVPLSLAQENMKPNAAGGDVTLVLRWLKQWYNETGVVLAGLRSDCAVGTTFPANFENGTFRFLPP